MKIKNLKVFGASMMLSGAILCNTGLSVSATNYSNDSESPNVISSIYTDEENPIYISNVPNDYTDGITCTKSYKKVFVGKEILEDGTICTEYKMVPVYVINPAGKKDIVTDSSKKISSISNADKVVTISNVPKGYKGEIKCTTTYKKVLVGKEVLEDGTISSSYELVKTNEISPANKIDDTTKRIVSFRYVDEPIYISNVPEGYTDGITCTKSYKKELVKKEVLEDGTISLEYAIYTVYEINPAVLENKLTKLKRR